jgi:hypothetical protein
MHKVGAAIDTLLARAANDLVCIQRNRGRVDCLGYLRVAAAAQICGENPFFGEATRPMALVLSSGRSKHAARFVGLIRAAAKPFQIPRHRIGTRFNRHVERNRR